MTWDEIRKIHTWLPSTGTGWHQHNNGGGWVQDTAHVDATAFVGERALVSGSASVFDSASVFGSAWVSKSPIWITGLRYGVLICDKFLTIGCQQHEPAKWRKFTPKQIADMDDDAAKFWRAHGASLLAMAKVHQAKPRKKPVERKKRRAKR